MTTPVITGAGLGLRRALLGPLAGARPEPVSFFEAVPENWMDIGGRLGRAGRIREVQALLDRRIALENASYYAAPGAEMSEVEFIRAVLEEGDCDLLLDVNNVWVNSINHRYDPRAFIDGLPLSRVRYLHVAGHYVEAEDLRIDTHGTAVCDEVWSLLDYSYSRLGPVPTLLERDFNIPPLETLLAEVGQVARLQDGHRPAALRLAAS